MDCHDDLVGKTGNEHSIFGWKLRTRIAAWRSKGGRENNIEGDVGRMCAAANCLNQLKTEFSKLPYCYGDPTVMVTGLRII